MDSTSVATRGPSPSRRALYKRVAVSGCALVLLVLHRFVPTLLPTDALGMGLLVVIALPWILGAIPLSELDLFGVKVKLDQVIDKQKEHGETLTAQGKIIEDLVTYSMSASIFVHLCGIGLLKDYGYQDNEANRREFYFLRDNGFIEPTGGGFLEFNAGTPRNVSSIAKPTPIGWLCIRLRRSEVPAGWLAPQNRSNLAVDPSTLN